MAKIDAFFNLMFEQKASDLHMSSGNQPMLRINGEMQRVDYPVLESDALKAMLYEIAPDYKIKQFEEAGDVDFGYEIPSISRFRVNFFNEKNGICAVFRQIPSRVLSFQDFQKLEAPLPPVLKKFCMLNRGLIVTMPSAVFCRTFWFRNAGVMTLPIQLESVVVAVEVVIVELFSGVSMVVVGITGGPTAPGKPVGPTGPIPPAEASTFQVLPVAATSFAGITFVLAATAM